MYPTAPAAPVLPARSVARAAAVYAPSGADARSNPNVAEQIAHAWMEVS
jgi:hypothetical protein